MAYINPASQSGGRIAVPPRRPQISPEDKPASDTKRPKVHQQYSAIGESPADVTAKEGGRKVVNKQEGGLRIDKGNDKRRKKVTEQLSDISPVMAVTDTEGQQQEAKRDRQRRKQPADGFFAQWKDHAFGEPAYNGGAALAGGAAALYLGGPMLAVGGAALGSLAEFQIHGRWTE
jgi:hypothetical protein